MPLIVKVVKQNKDFFHNFFTNKTNFLKNFHKILKKATGAFTFLAPPPPSILGSRVR